LRYWPSTPAWVCSDPIVGASRIEYHKKMQILLINSPALHIYAHKSRSKRKRQLTCLRNRPSKVSKIIMNISKGLYSGYECCVLTSSLLHTFATSSLQSNAGSLLTLALSALHVHHATLVADVEHALCHVLLFVVNLLEPLLGLLFATALAVEHV
jgi:hypothetical protein